MANLALASNALQSMAHVLMLEASPRRVSQYARQVASVNAQRRVRAQAARQLESTIEEYFGGLSKRVATRLKNVAREYGNSGAPNVAYLITREDDDLLEKTLMKAYVSIVRKSWDIYNLELGVSLAFNLRDPLVSLILGGCGTQIRAISNTTRDAVRQAMQYGNDQGWSIDQIVRGDAENNIPGLRDIVDETYKNRARAIARTELGNAQNEATVVRYQAAHVSKVRIFDNGKDDDDEPCKKVNGKIKSLDWFMQNKLQHPN